MGSVGGRGCLAILLEPVSTLSCNLTYLPITETHAPGIRHSRDILNAHEQNSYIMAAKIQEGQSMAMAQTDISKHIDGTWPGIIYALLLVDRCTYSNKANYTPYKGTIMNLTSEI